MLLRLLGHSFVLKMFTTLQPFDHFFIKGTALCSRLVTLEKVDKPLQSEVPFFNTIKKGPHSAAVWSLFPK